MSPAAWIASGIGLWCTVAVPFALVLGRVLRAASPVPMTEPAPVVDWLADQPVDVWSDLRFDAEFAAIVAPYEDAQ